MKQSLLQIDKKIAVISESVLVDVEMFKSTDKITRIDDLCRKIEDYRSETTDKMLVEYDAIVPLLGKIESGVVQSETKSHPVLKELYTFVELQIYNALVTAIVNGCNSLQSILQLQKPVEYFKNVIVNDPDKCKPLVHSKGLHGLQATKPHHSHHHHGQDVFQIVYHEHIETECKPLIQISFVMNSPPEIAIVPRIPDIHKSFSTLLKSIISTAYSFARWQKHSCILSGAVEIDVEDETKLYSFHDDIKDDPRVKNAFHRYFVVDMLVVVSHDA